MEEGCKRTREERNEMLREEWVYYDRERKRMDTRYVMKAKD